MIATTKRFKKHTTMLVMVTILILIATSLSGCGGNNEANAPAASNGAEAKNANAPAEDKGSAETVEVKGLFPGDTPQDFDTVLSAVNEKLAKDNVGVKLNIQFIPWSDYGDLVSVKASAGEDFDMFLDAPWLHMNQMITSGSIIPLDDYINSEKTPNLVKAIPQQMWDANKFESKIFGIPLGIAQGKINGFVIRKDLREKYGLGPIQSLKDMEAFLYKVKENEKDITPFGMNAMDASLLWENYFSETSWEALNKYMPIGVSFFVGTSEGKITALTDVPEYKSFTEKMTKFYKDGIFSNNIAQEENAPSLFNLGKFAAIKYVADGEEGKKYLDALKLPGAQLEIVPAYNLGTPKPYSDFKQWNFLVVNKNSKHPEKVLALSDWLSVKENHDLLELGIEGKHWKAVGDDQYETVEGSGYSFPGYVLTWRPTLVRTSVTMMPDDKKWFDYARDANNFTASPYDGFVANTDSIKTELAKATPIETDILKPLGLGVLDSSKGFASAVDAAKEAGGQVIVDELNKQYAAFTAGK
ncbi:extracellular solute-binding protein [Paenibacillus sp. BC26]|uniref:extracellular solute-binding protein n=1 Tax=Paenibacillus sp. BC26 TaxID=1881032 RepID=UPI0008E26294|nr:extracellular solute-binding protein [Paenibacillus sp. BC26]SFS57803.1 putative aldouronate transport system substrate-binding protein [Paenibacillus sp. BC26]